MKIWQSIHAARTGLHHVLDRSYLVEHAGQMTYCREVEAPAKVHEAGSREVPEGGSQYKRQFQTLSTRQRVADQQHSPWPDDAT